MNGMDVDLLIVGGGVIGLAVAAGVPEGSSAILVERHSRFGQESSSRNSEVVHSGIHYPPDSLKTRLCLRGRDLLYEFCVNHGVGVEKTGKIVVACDTAELSRLEEIARHSRALGVPVDELTASQVTRLEPDVRAEGGLHFQESGIVDSHELMLALEARAQGRGVMLAYGHRVIGVERAQGAWSVRVQAPGEEIAIRARRVVNAAGLKAAELHALVTGDPRYSHRYCRGRYLVLSRRFAGIFHRLVYPVPPKDGLGVHVTRDLAGNARLGPDVEWLSETRADALDPWYDCDWEALKPSFLAAAGRYLRDLQPGDLGAGLVGIRPKLFSSGTAVGDFLLVASDGWVHCLGIESPGLTSCLAIADEVHTVLAGMLGS